MQNLTVKDLYRVDEDNDQRFTWNINGVENEILYCKNESGICIQINTIYAKTAEERVECLRQFCEQMFGGDINY